MTLTSTQNQRAAPELSGMSVKPLLLTAGGWLLMRSLQQSGSAPRLQTAEPSAPRQRSEAAVNTAPHGRSSDEFPKMSWMEVAKRVAIDFNRHRIMALSAEMTFYSLLALFPGIAALVSLYGLFSNPAGIESQLQSLNGMLPGGALQIVGTQIKSLSSAPHNSLSIGFAFGLLVALWSANSGMKSIFDALNIVYEVEEKRTFIKLNLITLGITCGVLIFLILALSAMVAVPIVLSFVNVGTLGAIVSIARWPVLLVLVALMLAVIYRLGPSREDPKWRWITPGSALASLVWLGASMLFSWYVANFGSYNKTYGSLGAAIGFMTWMWISGMIILLGAEINAKAQPRKADARAIARGAQPRKTS